MPLPIRDGNQSLTTLSTILVSNSHIPAHTVISFGTQGITDIATAVSGVELGPNTLNALENITVTLGQVTITGGLTDAQLRASAVTIGGSVTASISGTSSVTFGTAVVTGSASILNFPATQTVTFTQASVTFSQATITGSVSVLNLPATQTVTFTTASVTFGTSVITGSASILNFPATQAVTFTQAPVTFGTAVITGSASIIGTPSVTFTQIATHGVTIANSSVTIGGTVTAQLNYVSGSAVGVDGGTADVAGLRLGYNSNTGNEFVIVTENSGLPISGTVTANGGDFSSLNINQPASKIQVGFQTIGGDFVATNEDGYPFPVNLFVDGTIVENANPIPISGTVTANSSNGSLTTRFGSVTTANTAFATSAVTNTNRKYLLIQNITTAANVITVGIGFTPTTTQGIQLFAGAGLTFEGSYIPTGAVNLLSSVTASCYTILEA
jgi:hypothetical protein